MKVVAANQELGKGIELIIALVVFSFRPLFHPQRA